MSLRRYRGLLVIVLWQAPNPVAVDSTGRIQGVFGFGGGQYENVRTSCEGDVLGASPVKFQGAGAQIDAWPIGRQLTCAPVIVIKCTFDSN